jgi:broad specificity phosphatase PhoE
LIDETVDNTFISGQFTDLIDTPLTELGIQQCSDKQAIANELDFEIVLISPMRRTIQTAYYMFKEHPNFDSIRFILVPNAHETLCAISDLPEANILSRILEFSHYFP